MRPHLFFPLVGALIAGVSPAGMALGQTATTAQTAAQTPPAEESAQAPDQNSPEWLDKQNNLGSAVLAPLDDLNLRKLKIPEILIQALHAPYDLTGLSTCPSLAAEVQRLDEVLGPDIDAPRSDDARNLTEKGEDLADKTAVGAVRDASTSFIPFRGMVRKLTGAEKHQRAVEAAIEAGQSRRAFVKGAGMTRNCAPPAAPYGFVPDKAPPAKSKPSKKR